MPHLLHLHRSKARWPLLSARVSVPAIPGPAMSDPTMITSYFRCDKLLQDYSYFRIYVNVVFIYSDSIPREPDQVICRLPGCIAPIKLPDPAGNFHDRISKGLWRLLWEVVSYTANEGMMNIFTCKFAGISGRIRVRSTI